MKRIALVFSAVVLFAGLTFAQTPQSKEKAAKPAEKKECVKDEKSGCDHKTKAACSEGKKPSGCCSHDGKKPAPATNPEKK
ncbi:MAG TPA: hypothetical protein PKG48_10180 [Bacteroidales bacterium]|nr:hypothetical protein [Bacteroidales bacterium]